LAIVPAAGNITESAADDIHTVTGATAMTLFVRQSKNLWRQPANAQIIWSPPVTGQLNSTGNYGRRCVHLYVRIYFLMS